MPRNSSKAGVKAQLWRVSAACEQRPDRPVEAYRDGARPLNDRPLDDAGLSLHQRLGRGGIRHALLRGRVELAPGGAFAVQQRLPAQLRYPGVGSLGRKSVFLEVVKAVRDAAAL